MPVSESYGDVNTVYSDEEWASRLRMAGCGPYLMTEEMMQPEKETKMSMMWGVKADDTCETARQLSGVRETLAQHQTQAALQQQIAIQEMYQGQSESEKSRANWQNLLNAGAQIMASTSGRDIFSDSAMKISNSTVPPLSADRVAFLEARLRELEALLAEDRKQLRAVLAASEETGNHDYIGPVSDGKAVADPVHENFHRAVGDVLSGKVMHEARKQMQEALKTAPRDVEPKSLPAKALRLPSMEKGVRL